MLRMHGLRYILVAALFFAFGTVHVAVAASTAFDQQLHRQDIGDDDGDGIPNYLDPDDNNDGIQDRDTPAPTAVPDPPVDEPDDVSPDNDSTVNDDPNQEQTPDPVTNPDESSDTTDQATQGDAPVVEEAQAAPVAPQVSALPDTGTGLEETSSDIGNAFVILVLLATGIAGANLKWKNRMP